MAESRGSIIRVVEAQRIRMDDHAKVMDSFNKTATKQQAQIDAHRAQVIQLEERHDRELAELRTAVVDLQTAMVPWYRRVINRIRATDLR